MRRRMTAPTPHPRCATIIRRTALAGLLPLGLVLWIGCGTAQGRYKVGCTFGGAALALVPAGAAERSALGNAIVCAATCDAAVVTAAVTGGSATCARALVSSASLLRDVRM